MATKNFFVHDGLKVRGNTLLNGTTYSSAPSAKLHVKTGSSAGANLNSVNGLIIENGGTSTNYALKVATGCGNIFNIQNCGSVGIGTVNPNETLTVVGNISASGSLYGNIEDLTFDTITITGDLNVGGTVFTDVLSAGTEIESPEFIGNLRGAVSFTAKAGEALTKGDAVYISGISGNTTVVGKADADDSSKMPAFGIANESVSLNSSVTIINFGALTNFNTSSFPEGTELFVGTTAGQLVSAAPTGESAAIQKIAKVTRQDATVGSITVMGAGRSNAVPNLNEGRLFVGNSSNQAVADGTIHVDIANSRVGIGTTAPNSQLHLYGASGATGEIRLESSNGKAFAIGSTGTSYGSANNLIIYDIGASAERLRVDTSGNVGIGTIAPSQKLEVTGNVRVIPSSGDAFIRLTDIGTRNWDLRVSDGSDYFEIDGTTSISLAIKGSGNVGIGTTDPNEKLTVSGNISASGVVYADTFCSNSGSCNTIDFNDNLDVAGCLVTSEDAYINTVRVGRGAGCIATNTVVGSTALDSITTGVNNTALGTQSLRFTTTGNYNTASGYRALIYNTTGSDNTASGRYALCGNTTGSYNSAHGGKALNCNTTGQCNTALGGNALFKNVDAWYNVAVGTSALECNITTSALVAVGYKALHKNCTGAGNTAIGAFSLRCNDDGYNNTASGYYALASNTSGFRNVAIGSETLCKNTTGNANTALGERSLFFNTTGTGNTATGYQSLYSNTTASKNTASGFYSLKNNTTGSNNTASGSYSLYCNTTGSDNSAFGRAALFSNTTGNYNTAVGRLSQFVNTVGCANTSVGYSSLRCTTSGTDNTAVGTSSLYCNTTGSRNTAYGVGSMKLSTTSCIVIASGTQLHRTNAISCVS